MIMDTLTKMHKNGIRFSQDDLIRLCHKYKIRELSIFGSAIREDFHQKSDVDFLVSFEKDSGLTLFDLVDLKEDFSELLHRDVDIVEKEGLTNPIRKRIILSTAEVVYVNT